MTRPIKVFKYEKDAEKPHYNKVPDGLATFHAFGCDYEEFETGAGNFSTAIIEREDGTVENKIVDLIQFTDVH